MTTYGTFQGKHYTFYLVDECTDYDCSPFGADAICIPVFNGMRTSCVDNLCLHCELSSGGDGVCTRLFTKFPPKKQQLFSDVTDEYPELLI